MAGMIGLLLFTNSLLGLFSTPLAGFLADKFKIDSRLLTISGFMTLSGSLLISVPGFLPALPITMKISWILPGVIIFGLFRRPMAPLIDTEALHYLERSGLGREHFGQIRVSGTYAWIVAGITGGIILYFTDQPSWALVSQAVWFLLLSITAMSGIHSRIKPVRIPWDHLKKNKIFGRFLIFIFIQSLAISSTFTFISYLLDDFMVNYLWIGVAYGLMAVTEIPAMLLAPKIIKKIGSRQMIFWGTAIRLAKLSLLLIFGPSGKTILILLITSLHGIGYGLHFTGMIQFVDSQAHKDLRATYLSIFRIVYMTLATSVGGLLSGLLIRQFGSEYMVLINIGIGIISLGALFFLLPDDRPGKRKPRPAKGAAI